MTWKVITGDCLEVMADMEPGSVDAVITDPPYMWIETHKGDERCRELADRHYTRQRPGHPMFCRPGYNQVLYFRDKKGAAVWVWWRPKWEDGRLGTTRKDGLQAIECTLFRNESGALSSDLIKDAVNHLPSWNRFAPHPDGLITGIGVEQTKGRRGKRNSPGHCYIMAGWKEFEHRSGRAGLWLRHPEIIRDDIARERIDKATRQGRLDLAPAPKTTEKEQTEKDQGRLF